MVFIVTIKGRDVIPCARLLEALTIAGLLDSCINWDENADSVVLSIGEDAKVAQAFEQKRFEVKKV